MIPSTLPPERPPTTRASHPAEDATTVANPSYDWRDSRDSCHDMPLGESYTPDPPTRLTVCQFLSRSAQHQHREVLSAAHNIPTHVAARVRATSRHLGAVVGTLWRSALARRVLSCLLLVLALSFACFTVAWQLAPSTAGLRGWVQRQDATHAAPYTPLAAVSPNVIHALIAIEDERFYQHHGIDTIGLLRAALTDLQQRSAVEGGSTLTAQLAKNAYLDGYDHSPTLKAEDLLLALKIEQRYSKSQILEMYLNLVYFGEGAYGIGAASERYFGVAPARLDIAQAALLAGMVQAPGMYDPWCQPTLARERQEAVLDRMVADGYITPAQEAQARAEKFGFFAPGATRPNDTYCAG